MNVKKIIGIISLVALGVYSGVSIASAAVVLDKNYYSWHEDITIHDPIKINDEIEIITVLLGGRSLNKISLIEKRDDDYLSYWVPKENFEEFITALKEIIPEKLYARDENGKHEESFVLRKNIGYESINDPDQVLITLRTNWVSTWGMIRIYSVIPPEIIVLLILISLGYFLVKKKILSIRTVKIIATILSIIGILVGIIISYMLYKSYTAPCSNCIIEDNVPYVDLSY